MSNDPLHERGKALEDRFFQERDRKLLENLRREYQVRTTKEALSAASGITDDVVLDDLIASQITAETLTAISIVPLVAVAWADEKMEPREIDAVLKAAHDAGIERGTTSHEIVRSWLATKPGDELLQTWKDYISSLKSTLSNLALEQLKSSVLKRARSVAESAGGFLGFGNKVSAVEQKVLDDLESVFSE